MFGYRDHSVRKALCLVASVLTCGVLLLLFYWRPQWRVWASCIPCPLREADTVLLRTTVRALLFSISNAVTVSSVLPLWHNSVAGIIFQRVDFLYLKSFHRSEQEMATLSLQSICSLSFWPRSEEHFFRFSLGKLRPHQANRGCSSPFHGQWLSVLTAFRDHNMRMVIQVFKNTYFGGYYTC